MKRKAIAVFWTVIVMGLSLTMPVFGANIDVPGMQPTIKDAILAANNGDTIIVSGPITEHSIVVNKNVIIQGATADPADTIVQAAANLGDVYNRVFEIDAAATVTIQNITIQNGWAPNGANGTGTAYPDNCGQDGQNGGGILNNGILTVSNCIIQDNRAGDGGDGILGGNGGNGSPGNTGKTGDMGAPNAGCPFWLTCCKDDAGVTTVNGCPGGDGESAANNPDKMNGKDGQDGGDGGNGGSGGGIWNNGQLTLLNNCRFYRNSAGDGGDGANAGNGGNGGPGGQGGNGGSAYIDTAGTGGEGGNGGNGGNAGNGGDGGSGGNGGSGGAIFGTSAGTISGISPDLFGSGIDANAFGTGSTVSGALGTAGDPGAAGPFGRGGQNGPYYALDPGGFATDGAPGVTGAIGAGGSNGVTGGDGAGPNYAGSPGVTTDSYDTVTSDSAHVLGTVTLDGGSSIIQKGICWSTQAEPDITNNFEGFSNAGMGMGTIDSTITLNHHATLYYVRAYAKNSGNVVGYGTDLTIVTKAIPPTVTTNANWTAGYNTANGGGEVTDNGGADIITRGVCWSTTVNPQDGDYIDCTHDNTGTGPFTSEITGLLAGGTYYVRAYAENNAGMSYDTTYWSFTTDTTKPTVTTQAPNPVTANSATANGTIVDDGGMSVTKYGFWWSKGQTPTSSSYEGTCEKTAPVNDGDTFNCQMGGLDYMTTYHVVSYATNDKGTSYSSDTTFMTPTTVPSVKTNPVTEFTATSAKFTGQIINNGGEAVVSERGFCWNTTNFATQAEWAATLGTSNCKVSSDTTVFETSAMGLNSGTGYYVAAYARNARGASFGMPAQPFTTLTPITPKVKTNEENLWIIASTTLTGGGEAIGDGNAPIIQKGICWNKTGLPMLELDGIEPDNKCTNDGTGLGTFGSVATGLEPGVPYYVRAYAKNDAGMVGYGVQYSLTTKSPCNAGDVDGNGTVELADAIMALKILAGVPLNTNAYICMGADANGDGKIGIEEVIFILRKVLGVN